jgi:hypothetical protein
MDSIDHSEEGFNVGTTFANDTYRIHRFYGSIKITHLVNAGKRGKKCLEISVSGRRDEVGMESLALEFKLHALRNCPLERMLQAVQEAVEIGCQTYQEELRGIDVIPGNLKSFEIIGEHVYMKANGLDFLVRNRDDQNNDPTSIPTNKKAAPLFYAWVVKNEAAIPTMSYHDVLKAMDALTVGYRSYCAVY